MSDHTIVLSVHIHPRLSQKELEQYAKTLAETAFQANYDQPYVPEGIASTTHRIEVVAVHPPKQSERDTTKPSEHSATKTMFVVYEPMDWQSTTFNGRKIWYKIVENSQRDEVLQDIRRRHGPNVTIIERDQ